jgi:hypothetical protein
MFQFQFYVEFYVQIIVQIKILLINLYFPKFLTELFAQTHGTLRFRGTPVGKHCRRVWCRPFAIRCRRQWRAEIKMFLMPIAKSSLPPYPPIFKFISFRTRTSIFLYLNIYDNYVIYILLSNNHPPLFNLMPGLHLDLYSARHWSTVIIVIAVRVRLFRISYRKHHSRAPASKAAPYITDTFRSSIVRPSKFEGEVSPDRTVLLVTAITSARYLTKVFSRHKRFEYSEIWYA